MELNVFEMFQVEVSPSLGIDNCAWVYFFKPSLGTKPLVLEYYWLDENIHEALPIPHHTSCINEAEISESADDK